MLTSGNTYNNYSPILFKDLISHLDCNDEKFLKLMKKNKLPNKENIQVMKIYFYFLRSSYFNVKFFCVKILNRKILMFSFFENFSIQY